MTGLVECKTESVKGELQESRSHAADLASSLWKPGVAVTKPANKLTSENTSSLVSDNSLPSVHLVNDADGANRKWYERSFHNLLPKTSQIEYSQFYKPVTVNLPGGGTIIRFDPSPYPIADGINLYGRELQASEHPTNGESSVTKSSTTNDKVALPKAQSQVQEHYQGWFERNFKRIADYNHAIMYPHSTNPIKPTNPEGSTDPKTGTH